MRITHFIEKKQNAQDALRAAHHFRTIVGMGIGQKIKQYRIDKGLTLADVETRAGLADGNLSRIERGKQWLTEEKLYAIADALRVHPAEFFIDAKFQSGEGGQARPLASNSKEDEEWLNLRSFLGSDDIKEFTKTIKERQARNIRLMRELDGGSEKRAVNIEKTSSSLEVLANPHKKQSSGSL
jgi:transcriptional regulator with XRE-family HTH domain